MDKFHFRKNAAKNAGQTFAQSATCVLLAVDPFVRWGESKYNESYGVDHTCENNLFFGVGSRQFLENLESHPGSALDTGNVL